MTWLDQVKARLKAATPGPWEGMVVPDEYAVNKFELLALTVPDEDKVEPTANLIAHAPTDLDKAIRIIECYERALGGISMRIAKPISMTDAIMQLSEVETECDRTLAESERIKGETTMK